MSFEIIDADGHVTETWEQIARHLDEPYRKRPLQTPFFPQDGWDRRTWVYVEGCCQPRTWQFELSGPAARRGLS